MAIKGHWKRVDLCECGHCRDSDQGWTWYSDPYICRRCGARWGDAHEVVARVVRSLRHPLGVIEVRDDEKGDK